MALSIKKLGTRALTALIFVIVLLSGLLTNYQTFTLLFFIIALWGLSEFYKVALALGASPNKYLGHMLGVLCYLSFVRIEFLTGGMMTGKSLSVWFLVAVPSIIFAAALFNTNGKAFSNTIYTLAGILYAVLPFALLHELVVITDPQAEATSFSPFILLGVILLIWCNDTFAYLGGSLFGKHKLVERISPGKTWEGTIIGVLLTFGGSFVIAHYIEGYDSIFWMMAGILVPVLATVGDLIQSTMKREANLKDTGSIMPGHGGILDRFDSLIFVSPFVVLIARLFT